MASFTTSAAPTLMLPISTRWQRRLKIQTTRPLQQEAESSSAPGARPRPLRKTTQPCRATPRKMMQAGKPTALYRVYRPMKSQLCQSTAPTDTSRSTSPSTTTTQIHAHIALQTASTRTPTTHPRPSTTTNTNYTFHPVAPLVIVP